MEYLIEPAKLILTAFPRSLTLFKLRLLTRQSMLFYFIQKGIEMIVCTNDQFKRYSNFDFVRHIVEKAKEIWKNSIPVFMFSVVSIGKFNKIEVKISPNLISFRYIQLSQYFLQRIKKHMHWRIKKYVAPLKKRVNGPEKAVKIIFTGFFYLFTTKCKPFKSLSVIFLMPLTVAEILFVIIIIIIIILLLLLSFFNVASTIQSLAMVYFLSLDFIPQSC